VVHYLIISHVVCSYQVGHIKEPETATSGKTPVHVYFDKVPHILTSAPGVLHTKWMFLTAIHTSKAKAKAAYLLGRFSYFILCVRTCTYLCTYARMRRVSGCRWIQIHLCALQKIVILFTPFCHVFTKRQHIKSLVSFVLSLIKRHCNMDEHCYRRMELGWFKLSTDHPHYRSGGSYHLVE